MPAGGSRRTCTPKSASRCSRMRRIGSPSSFSARTSNPGSGTAQADHPDLFADGALANLLETDKKSASCTPAEQGIYVCRRGDTRTRSTHGSTVHKAIRPGRSRSFTSGCVAERLATDWGSCPKAGELFEEILGPLDSWF